MGVATTSWDSTGARISANPGRIEFLQHLMYCADNYDLILGEDEEDASLHSNTITHTYCTLCPQVN